MTLGSTPVGTLDYIWKGDPARGCAAEGLCGVAGSLQVATGNSATASNAPGLPPVDIADDSAVARVEQFGPDGTPQACVDTVPYEVQFDLRHVTGGQLRAVPEPSGQPPSAGRCAGPTATDLLSAALPAHRDARRSYDLSGSVSFGAGPFTVTVISKIHVRFVSSSASGGPPPPVSGSSPRVPKPRAALAEHAEVRYRVTGVQGGLLASFSGLDEPFCTPLNACGMAGAVSLALRAPGRTVVFSGSRVVKRRVGSRQALADLRAGRLRLTYNSPQIQLSGELAGTLAGANATPCQDTVSDSSLGLAVSSARAGYRLVLDPPGPVPSFGGTDQLRTRCPGPGSSEILGTHPLASDVVTAHSVGASRLTIALSASGQFRGTAYGGSRSGSIVLTLVRASASGGTQPVTVSGGRLY